jgi:hypothetical protein
MKIKHQPSLRVAIIIALWNVLALNCTNGQSDQLSFPNHWGSPPTEQTNDFVTLPYGYGFGSSTLANWIETNVKLNRFPEAWGKAPNDLADDYVKLPGNYGYGSSTLRTWILYKMGNLKLSPAPSRSEVHLQEWRPYPSPSPHPTPSPISRRQPPIRVYAR